MGFSLVVRKNKRVCSWSVILDLDGRDGPVHGIRTIILTESQLILCTDGQMYILHVCICIVRIHGATHGDVLITSSN